jgi:hypothetical protein
MLENGQYSVWFKTPQAQGTGVVVLKNGKIAGKDTVIAYSRFYEQDGDRFTAVVAAQRLCEGQPSLFGVDKFELNLVGRSTRTIIVCSGTKDQAPGLIFEATLIRCHGQAPSKPAGASLSIVPFNAAKFAKVRGGR